MNYENQQIVKRGLCNVAGAAHCAAKPPAFAGSVTGFKKGTRRYYMLLLVLWLHA